MGDDLYEGTFDEVIDKPDSNGAGAGQTASGSKPQGAALPVIQIDEGNLLGVIEQSKKQFCKRRSNAYSNAAACWSASSGLRKRKPSKASPAMPAR
jgi:hypothetical protein